MVTILSLKTLFKISLSDEEINPHLERAKWDYKNESFLDSDGLLDEKMELEAVGSKAIYYLAPLLWVVMQNRVDEYDETLETYRDIKIFQSYWLNRADSVFDSVGTDEDDLKWTAI